VKTYKILEEDKFSENQFSLVPIRFQDRYNIMDWRNEQIYHLRQTLALSKNDQDAYFSDVIERLFDELKPSQLLFSYLENDICIGYGGLVHINWIDSHAEISFIMDTKLEKIHFQEHWKRFTRILEKIAFDNIGLHKIFTYAFDLRPQLYQALESIGFNREATLKEHCLFEGKFHDVVIHSKIKRDLILLPAENKDIDITFEWALNPIVRRYALSKDAIEFEKHKTWFQGKLQSDRCFYFIAWSNQQPVGSYRMDLDDNGTALISYLLDPAFHGLGFGYKLLSLGLEAAKSNPRIQNLEGMVDGENIASIKVFERLNFKLVEELEGLMTYSIETK
jgi:RimJ/RimL family protein N-acetyltransferase